MPCLFSQRERRRKDAHKKRMRELEKVQRAANGFATDDDPKPRTLWIQHQVHVYFPPRCDVGFLLLMLCSTV